MPALGVGKTVAIVDVGASTTSLLVLHDLQTVYTRGLFAASPQSRPAGQGRARLAAIPGTVPDPRALPPGCAFAARCPRAEPDCAVLPLPTGDVACLHPFDKILPCCHLPALRTYPMTALLEIRNLVREYRLPRTTLFGRRPTLR
eukprot:gene14908-19731_t